MTIKWSEFGDYDPTLAEPGDMTGVGLQSGLNVRWPAWFLQSSETVTTDHTSSSVYINPDVYTTQITTDGSGLVQNIKLPFINTGSFFDVGGIPGRRHLIVLTTQPNGSDIVNIITDGNLYLYPFNTGVGNTFDRSVNQFEITPFNSPPSTIQLTSLGDGIYVEWTGDAWYVAGIVGRPNIIPINAAQYWDDLSYAAPAVLYQDEFGDYAAVPDPNNPEFQITIQASSDINNPALIPAAVRSVVIQSVSASTTYVQFESPLEGYATSGMKKTVEGNGTGGGRIIVPSAFISSALRNGDGNSFTAFDVTQAKYTFTAKFSSAWYVDGDLCVNPSTTPDVVASNDFVNVGFPYARQLNGNVTIPPNANYGVWVNTLASSIFTVPQSNSQGSVYTFAYDNTNSRFDTVVVRLIGDALSWNGSQYVNAAITTSEVGSQISLRDIGSPGNDATFGIGGIYVVQSVSGNWTLNVYAYFTQISGYSFIISLSRATNYLAVRADNTSTAVGSISPTYQKMAKYYFEVTFTTVVSASTSNYGCGIVSASVLAGTVGFQNFGTNGSSGAILHLDGKIWANGSDSGSTLGTRAQTDVIGVAVDFDNLKIWYKKVNGTPTGWNNATANANDPATNVGGVTFVAGGGGSSIAVAFGGTGAVIHDVQTLNPGSSAFIGTVPSGFFSGWPQQ